MGDGASWGESIFAAEKPPKPFHFYAALIAMENLLM